MKKQKFSVAQLELPYKCALMEKEEMQKIAGGSISLDMQPNFTSKQICLNVAAYLLAAGAIKDMTQLQVAQEIYGHAVAYYAASGLQNLGLDNSLVQSLIASAHRIDIADGGDTFARQVAFAIIWDRVQM